MKSIFTLSLVGMLAMCAFAAPGRRGAPPPPPRHHHGGHHHHHHSKAIGIGAGILGAGLLASTIYEATRPAPVVVAQPAVVVTPAPVVVQQPVVAGHYETRVQNVWVEGRYVDQVVNGVVQRVWQPGHYEQQQTQVWVSH